MYRLLHRPARVLLVEDNPDDVQLFKLALSEARVEAELTVAGDGQEALDILKGSGYKPDIIFLDLNMPRLDGRRFLEIIKADPELLLIPTQVMTTSAAPEDILGAYSHHANSYITKPAEFEHLMETVRKIRDYWLEVARLPTEVNEVNLLPRK